VSATTVRLAAGTRYGLATGFLDMAKVAVPTVIWRGLRPGDSSHLFVAAGGLLGHDLPIYHRFKGGRGESPIIGVMLALDPVGLVATQALGIALGLVVGDIVVLRWGGMALLVPWEAFVRRNRPLAAWMLFADLVYLTAMRGELQQYIAMVRSGRTPSHEEITREYGMGEGLGRFIDRYSLRAIVSRRRNGGDVADLAAGDEPAAADVRTAVDAPPAVAVAAALAEPGEG
jgi:glycerol-3-phosphate acyltransferase PlsY